MNIALCDDEPKHREVTVALIKKYKELRPDAEVKLSSFSCGDDLLAHLDKRKKFDIYILDVIMPAPNGIQIGLEIRNRNDDGLIIYLTTSPDFAVDSYQTRAFYYLLKPVAEEKIFEVLDAAYLHIETQKSKGITVKTTRGNTILIPLNTIYYVELIGRSSRYYLTSGEIIDSMTFRKSFHTEIESLLNHEDFTLCGSSFAINLKYVTEVRKADAVISNGSLIPISRNLYGKVKKQWMLYWLERR